MYHLHLEKQGIRGLVIAESFSPDSVRSVLAGIVMRYDFVIDGFVFGHASLEGDDSTDEILRMYKKLGRPDISYLLLSGVIISLYNIIDLKSLYDSLKIPVIGVTYKKSSGIQDSIKYHFPSSYESKLHEYEKLGKQEKIKLHTSFDVYVHSEGCSLNEVKQLLNHFTMQGAVPEPLRIAQLLAKSVQEI